ncbi:putative transcriptional regulator [Desulfohalotomaculum tongense]|uniref:hypothetical protein n=1 Tax=Desulforadius tongensis TaxID=1216062 RepID=UPI00195D342A|nr:hypothetical protein [Desulforadius tongensis]MBM7854314.1 putative transcriptional regulator [Desulforadius tongensis]
MKLKLVKRIWSNEEHIIAFYLYRFGYEELGVNYSRIAEIMGRTPDSLIMRFANFLNVEKKGSGLSGGGEKAREIYKRYKDTPKDELRKMVVNILLSAASKSNE